MKLSDSLLALATLLASNSAAALDCSATVSRATTTPDESVCLHFGAVSPEGYREWYDTNGIAEKYPNYVYMPGSDPAMPENGVAVHWKLDGDYLNLAVAARATGWLGFGIGEAGGMLGADMVLFTAANPNELVDAYTTDQLFPQEDCSNDWELVNSNIDADGFIMFETRRLLDTNDPQDQKIVDDSGSLIPPHRVIAAWGDTPAVGYHALNRSRGAVRFYGTGDDLEDFNQAMTDFADGDFVVRSINHEIPAMDTEYFETCFGRSELIELGVPDTGDKLHVIGFEPVLYPETEAYVHHFVVAASPEPNCDNEDVIGEMAYVWAPGEGPLALPENMGSPLFGPDGYQSFRIEVHYDNPLLTPGVIDNSGVRFYWTSEAREHDVGVMQVGDANVGLYGEAVGEGLSLHQFECPSSCSSLVQQPVTVLREYLHMHGTGARITNEQIRDGEVIHTGSVEFWDFDQNGNAAVLQDPFVVEPGDSFRTSCYFDAQDDTVFGLSSREEMCMGFLYYYPRMTIEVDLFELTGEDMGTIDFPWFCGYALGFPACEVTYQSQTLESVADFNREFGIQVDLCDESPDSDDASADDEDEEDGAAMSLTKPLIAAGAMLLAGFLV